jgi:hypothetical protein
MAKPHYFGTFNFDKMARLTGITMTGNPEVKRWAILAYRLAE